MVLNVHLIGQSNMGKWYDNRIPARSYYGEDVPVGSQIYIGNVPETLPVTKYSGPGVAHFTRCIKQELAEDSYFVASAQGGTSTQEWIDTYVNIALGQIDSSAVSRADIDLVIWCQGEADASSGLTAAQHTSNLETVFTNYLAGLAPNVPDILIVKLPNATVSPRLDILQGQTTFASQEGYPLSGLDFVATVDNGIHFMPGYYTEQAHDTAEKYLNSTITINGRPQLLNINSSNVSDSSQSNSPVFICGGEVQDYIKGSSFDDVLYTAGTGIENYLIGGSGSNQLHGGDGETFFVPCSSTNYDFTGDPQVSLINLTGNTNTIILGDSIRPYYLSGNDLSYCIIWDFNTTQDEVRLHGSQSLYTVVAGESFSFQGSTVTADALRWVETGELIALFRGGDFSLSNSTIKYVNINTTNIRTL